MESFLLPGRNQPHLRRWVRKPLRLLQQLAVDCVCQGPSASSFASFEALLRPFLLVLQLRGFDFPQVKLDRLKQRHVSMTEGRVT